MLRRLEADTDSGLVVVRDAAAAVAFPLTRPLWPYAIALLAVGWLPCVVLQRLPRYRDIEQRTRDYEKALPSCAIQLRKTASADDLVGGHLDVSQDGCDAHDGCHFPGRSRTADTMQQCGTWHL
jgi:hypothetical protein